MGWELCGPAATFRGAGRTEGKAERVAGAFLSLSPCLPLPIYFSVRFALFWATSIRPKC